MPLLCSHQIPISALPVHFASLFSLNGESLAPPFYPLRHVIQAINSPIHKNPKPLLTTPFRLASVNFCLGIVGVIQVSRIINYNYFTKKETTGQQIEEAKGDLKSVAGELKGKVEDAVKQ